MSEKMLTREKTKNIEIIACGNMLLYHIAEIYLLHLGNQQNYTVIRNYYLFINEFYANFHNKLTDTHGVT